MLASLLLLAATLGLPAETPKIEAYCDALSVVPGEMVRFHLPTPRDASARGCRWPAGVVLPVPDDWKSGYYAVKFTAGTAAWNAFFVVRAKNPGAETKILLQLATNTYCAYNNWGNYCLYAFNAKDHVQGRRVSFDRPMVGQAENWEIPFIAWAEGAGYKLDYAVNSDLEFHPEILPNHKLVLSVGHDEYWSAPMRDNLEAYIGNGGNVAFFSGNSVCWQVRSEDGGRALACVTYRNFNRLPCTNGA